MVQIGPMLAASGKLSLAYAERVLKDVKREQFGRLAAPGGHVVQSNHPAFNLGHLCLYPPRILQLIDKPAGEAAAPATYEGLFKAGCECRDDVDGKLYPSMEELTGRFFTGYRVANAAVEAADDSAFSRPNPTEGRMRELFPTIGAAMGFYLSGHMQNHLGQLSAWRRMMGLPPAT